MAGPTAPYTPGGSGNIPTLAAAGSNAANANVIALAADHIGTGASGVSAPAGAVGLLGWLSGLFSTLHAIPASGLTAISGSFSAVGGSASFTPIVGRGGFNVTVRGTFVASVQLERSIDSGATWDPLTSGQIQIGAWTAPASEIYDEPQTGVFYRLHCTSYTSGPVTYVISQ